MNINVNRIILGLVLFTTSLHGQDKNNVSSKEQKPNIIFIMTDDHSKRAMSAYSHDLIETPHLDKIAEKGIKFNNAFVTNSICGPSRAVFLTGKFSHINGFKSNDEDVFDGSQPTLPKYLKQAGYYTSVIGKWHLGSVPQGFDKFDILIDQGEYYSPRFFNGKDTVVVPGYATEVITEKAIQLFEEQKNSGKPIFLMLHEKAPHRNWLPNTKDLNNVKDKEFPLPETFFDDYSTRSQAAFKQDMRIENMFLGYDLKVYLKQAKDETGTGGDSRNNSFTWLGADLSRMNKEQRVAWDQYYKPISDAYYSNKPIGTDLLKWKYNRYMNDYLKTVKSVDDNVGKLMEYLKKNGLDKNTLIIYTSDQGFFLGEHGWYDKRFMYEPSLQIPLVMCYPGHIKENITENALVQNVDLAPTILKAAGLPVPNDMQGNSLTPFFSGQKVKKWKDKLYYHYYENTVHHVEKHLGIRTKQYKLIYFYDIKDWELYDLSKDPNEVKNLYHDPSYKKTSDKLKLELKELIRKYKDTTAVNF
ncbi:sulfatase family protein [Elizabethkingia anophelis]|uniref:sulfatase family protein n=1 Tax=Elizabethkingia anophelis TaxID=1117645 RepID=UPI0009992DFC|nr:sulfatase [Elizabethkingia anophelis]OPC40961.1 sulfatase [Elizabethkingia anophelis]